MSGAGKMGDRGGGRESTKSLNKSKQTKHAIEVDQKKQREQYLLTRPKYSLTAPHITMPPADENLLPMIDASCHLLSRSFNRDLIAVMRRAKSSGVIGCVLQCDWTRVNELMTLVKQWPGQMFACIGMSPDSIGTKGNDKIFESRMEQLLDLALQPEVVSISCGLDLTRDLGTHFLQTKAFNAQIALARQVRLPVLVHEKAAAEQICEQLIAAKASIEAPSSSATASSSSHPHGKPDPIIIQSSTASPFPKIAIHNFNGTASDLDRYLKNDCFIIINGLVCDVRAAGEAASSSQASSADLKEKQKRDEEAKTSGEQMDDVQEEEEEEKKEREVSDGSGLKVQSLVGPADLSGAGAHLFHLIRSGLLPLERLMIATDAPLHTPQNISDYFVRTSRNEPSNMPHIFIALAKAYGRPTEEIQQQVFATSKAFFSLLNEAEFAVEEERAGEKERAKQLEEKKLLDRQRRSEAEAKKKERERVAREEEQQEAAQGAGKRANKKAAKGGAKDESNTKDQSDDEEESSKQKKKGGKKQAAAPAKKDESDDDDAWGKAATKSKQAKKKQAQQKKKTKKEESEEEESEEEEEEEEEEEVKPKKKAAVAPPAGKAKEAKSTPKKKVESESESEDEEKPTKQKVHAAKKAKKAESSSSSSSSESDDDEPLPIKAKPKKKVVSSSSSESSESESDDEPTNKKKSAESISAAKRARAAAIKQKQDAVFAARTQGVDEKKVAKGKKVGGVKKGEDEVDELDELFMAQSIDGLDAAAIEQQKKLEAARKKESASAASSSSSSALPDDRQDESVTFRCRKCQAKLFTNEHDLGHDETSMPSAAKDYSACEQIFIRRPKWIDDEVVDDASASATPLDLLCPKCQAKVGRVSSTPLSCACGRLGGGSAAPYVAVKMSRIDAVTTSAASIKGPRAIDADELDKARADADESHERLRQKEKERMKAKDKAKKASLMPVAESTGNFNQFRNKSYTAHHTTDTKKPKRQYQKTEESD